MLDPVSSSYWQKTTPPVALSSDLPESAEIVVVGGGILGTAISYWLARLGYPPTLLERSALAYGATGRNGGFVTTGLAESYAAATTRLGQETARRVLQLTLENRQLMRQVIAEEEIVCAYREPGHITLALDEKQGEAVARSVAALQAEGMTTQLIDRRGIEEHLRTPLAAEIVGGKYTPDSGVVHPAKLVQGLAQAAQRSGAKMYAASVQNITTEHDHMQLHTTAGTISAQRVIVAVNAWTGELLREIRPWVTPVRGQALAYQPAGPVFSTSVSALITSTEEYWQQTLDGTIVIGGCRAVAPGQDVNVWESVPTPEVQEALQQVLPRLFPSLHDLTPACQWAGLMAFTPDLLPIVDTLPDQPDIWFGGGFSGHGMAYSLRLGQLVAESVIKRSRATPLDLFRLDRPTLASR